MANTATVQAYDTNKSGRTKVKLDGNWYNVGNGVDLGPQTVSVGSPISFDSSSSDFNGKPVWWLNNYAKLPGTTNGVHAVPAPAVETPPTTAPQGVGTAPIVLPEHLALISNAIAHAIDKGFIENPAQALEWATVLGAGLRTGSPF